MEELRKIRRDGLGLGTTWGIPTDEFAVQPAGYAEDDLPGGIRER